MNASSDTGSAPRAKFGTVLGIAPGGVPVHSCDYDSADDGELPNRHAYRSYVDGIYMGYKWQCVELARRWLYVNRGWIFDEIAMAYDIFRLRSVRVVGEDRRLPLRAFRNGCQRHPEPGALLIWDEGGEFEHTGHVAVITEVTEDHVRIIEQNHEDSVWAEGQTYSRSLRVEVSDAGDYWIENATGDAEILGWMLQTDDDLHAEPVEETDFSLYTMVSRFLRDRGLGGRAWLNIANPDEHAYVRANGGHKLSSRPSDALRFFAVSETAREELERASNELHNLFLHATDYVLQDDALLERFNIPRAIWPRIHQSWDNRRNQMITGRFDFSVSDRGIKVYEYNCDSASCHMETGKVQGRWARHFGCEDGDDAGAELHAQLVEAWREAGVDGLLHIMLDRDDEETYHALFMREAIERAGIRTTVLHGLEGLSWDEEGNVRDPDGERIRWVWKTWAWETALDQIRAECEDDAERLASYRPGEPRDEPPRLVDVLLRPDVMVFEPLWTLIPSNKAILPILWQLFPGHPYLLNCDWTLNDDLAARGYVTKPIAGRCGHNVTIHAPEAGAVAGTGGRFGHQDQIYQEYFPLPEIDGDNVQVCTFSVSGLYAGACVRVDPSLIVTTNSDLVALRVVEDDRLRHRSA